MVPGPINYEPSVLRELAIPTPSHMSQDFATVFKETMEQMREILNVDGKILIMAGSGTLAMEAAALNILRKGDRALVLCTGVFGERFADILETYGVAVEKLRYNWGEAASAEGLRSRLEESKFNAVFITHVDTSTAVLNDVKSLSKVAKDHGCLTVVDGVAATGGIEEDMDGWGIDVVVTASQKALGIPPGLAIAAFGNEALRLFRHSNEAGGYYVSLSKWLNVIESFENGRAAYFSTPPVNLIYALHRSLKILLEEGLDRIYRKHALVGKAFREAMRRLGLRLVPLREGSSAPTLSAVWYPSGVSDEEFRGLLYQLGVVVAGGLGEYAGKYFRVGHMGRVSLIDLAATVTATELALKKLGFDVLPGAGVGAVEEILLEKDGIENLTY